MEILCSFAGVSPCCGELNKKSEPVQLTQCRDDVTNHLHANAVHLSKSNLSEVQLIFARAGMFNIREEKIHAFFYKNNDSQICPKIKNKLRTTEARLHIQM